MCEGGVSEDDVREVFGADFEEFKGRRELVNLVTETPNRETSDDLCD